MTRGVPDWQGRDVIRAMWRRGSRGLGAEEGRARRERDGWVRVVVVNGGGW